MSYSLPNISSEQQNVINNLNEHNVIVDSVAGSGKTTTIIYIAKENPKKNILLLTYNSKLKIETRNRVKNLGLKNIEVHSYHSYCVKYYDNFCYTDSKIRELINTESVYIKLPKDFDIIILDEAQDITPLYFELICKIIKDLNCSTKICIFGDRNQSIYGFNKADERYIIYGDKLFNFNELTWKKENLKESFRITDLMAEFINNCMLEYDRIISNKKSVSKVKYNICDCMNNDVNTEIYYPLKLLKDYLEEGYLPDEIFILAPSIKSEKTPVRIFENQIKKTIDIPVFVPVSDDEKLDEDIIKNKLVFSSFHQAKGLERKIVIIFNFDNSYFKFYAKDKDPNICPNELYVATTRALEHLVLLHHYENDYLQFISEKRLEKYSDYKIVVPIQNKNYKDYNKNIKTPITDLLNNLSQEVVDECYNRLTITNIILKQEKLGIPTKTQQKNGFENVSEITGVAIPALFEYKLKGDMTILDTLKDNVKDDTKDDDVPIAKTCLFSSAKPSSKLNVQKEEVLKNKDLKDKELKINLKNIKLNNITSEELLYVANKWCSYMTGFIFKTYQITTYNWLTQDNLEKCMQRLQNLNISENAEFEKRYFIENEKELKNRQLIGYCDCIDIGNVYEFKCVDELKKEHYLQLILYKYLIEMNGNNFMKNGIISFFNGDNYLKPGLKVLYRYKNEIREGKIDKIYSENNINVRYSYRLNKIKKDDILFKTKKKDAAKKRYLLFNILTNELNQVDCDLEKLKELVHFIIVSKYFNVYKITDHDFILNNIKLYKKYF
jgi:hypothetical protein